MKNSSPDRSEAKNQKKSSWWKKILTTVALASTLTACDKIPNNQIIIDPAAWVEQFSFEYHLWNNDPVVIDFDVTVYKDWDIYKWLINQKEAFSSKKTTVEASTIDDLFKEIIKVSETGQISGNTKHKRDAKISVAKQAYKNCVINAKNTENIKKIKIKYRPQY